MRKVKSTFATKDEENKASESDYSDSVSESSLSQGSLSDVLGPRRDAFNNSM